MDQDAQKLAALEEELKRDLEAIARVRHLMAIKNGSLSAPDSRQLNLAIGGKMNTSDEEDEAPVPSLRGTIEKLINSDPNVRWTTQKVLLHLQQTGFPLKAQKPIYSIGQALQNLVEKGAIRLVRRGTGSAPNLYKGKSQEQGGADMEAHSGGDIAKESTMTG
jgi:hypothetical protein